MLSGSCSHELAGGFETLGPDDVGAAGAIGERTSLFEKSAVAKRPQECVVRRYHRMIELRLADREDEIFHGLSASTDAAQRRKAVCRFLPDPDICGSGCLSLIVHIAGS